MVYYYIFFVESIIELRTGSPPPCPQKKKKKPIRFISIHIYGYIILFTKTHFLRKLLSPRKQRRSEPNVWQERTENAGLQNTIFFLFFFCYQLFIRHRVPLVIRAFGLPPTRYNYNNNNNNNNNNGIILSNRWTLGDRRGRRGDKEEPGRIGASHGNHVDGRGRGARGFLSVVY